MRQAAYVAGPMTGHPDMNFPAFKAATKFLRQSGMFARVICPTECCPDANAAWHDAMKLDIAAAMTADSVVLLPGWPTSKGATLEAFLHLKFGSKFYSLVESEREPVLVDFDDYALITRAFLNAHFNLHRE